MQLEQPDGFVPLLITLEIILLRIDSIAKTVEVE